MNLPSNNAKAGVTLLESLVMLAVLALVMGLAASGFRGVNRPESTQGIRARLAQTISLARNQALRNQETIAVSLSQLNTPFNRITLAACDASEEPLIMFPDGTVLAPDLCTDQPNLVRFRIDWLTGVPELDNEE